MARRLKSAPITGADPQTNVIAPADLARLEELYSFRNHVEVAGWLEDYPFLIPLLFEGYGSAQKHFPNALLVLEVHYDPEEAGLTHLVAYIRTNLDPDAALTQQARFDTDWWLEAMDRSDMKLDFDVEFSR